MTIDLVLTMTPDVRQKLVALRKTARAANDVETIRWALAVYEKLLEETEAGGRVVIERPGGVRVPVTLMPDPAHRAVLPPATPGRVERALNRIWDILSRR